MIRFKPIDAPQADNHISPESEDLWHYAMATLCISCLRYRIQDDVWYDSIRRFSTCDLRYMQVQGALRHNISILKLLFFQVPYSLCVILLTRGQSIVDNLPLPGSGHMHESKQAAKTRVEKMAPNLGKLRQGV